MFNYIRAENLKCKRTFAKKLVVIAPVCMLALAFLSGMYFVENGYNWWYTLILPGFVTLLTALVNQYEDKKLRYRSVLALPVSLKKIWASKVILIGIYAAAANLLHMAGIMLGKSAYNSSSKIEICQMAAATLLLIITSLWQIPLCLFLSKKFGLMAAVLLNLGGGIFLGIFCVTKTFWWICPYSWAMRMMSPVLGVLPAGVMAKAGDPMLNPLSIPIGTALSLLLFAVLLVLTSVWFARQEAK